MMEKYKGYIEDMYLQEHLWKFRKKYFVVELLNKAKCRE